MLLALDPGKVTGYAMKMNSAWGAGEVPSHDVWGLLESHKQIECLVVERFQYSGEMIKVDLTPAEVIGVIKLWADMHNVPIFWQTRHQGKFYWTDDRLKEEGRWVEGMQHARDATRHLLYFLTFNKVGKRKYGEENA